MNGISLGVRTSLLLLLLLILVVISLGYPHGNDPWFAFLYGEEAAQLFKLFRLPEICISIIAGMALSISGLLLQTTLNNPLAGPSILGITSGSQLMVALVLMGGEFLTGWVMELSITLAAAFGAVLFGLLMLVVAARVRSTVSLLLVGMMLGTFASAITGLLISKADGNAVKSFSMWSFGSLQQVNMEQIPWIVAVFLIGVLGLFFVIKGLNALLLGEQQASLLGIHVGRLRIIVILIVSLLTGLITAYCGPIAFIGLVIPNLVRIYLKTSNHWWLLLTSAILGAIVLLFCSLLIRIVEPWIVLPINSLTSLLGAPVVVLLLIKRKTHA
ncbi:MAG: FecCD family ABC transporter permease [Fluviicola sp.]